VNFVVVIGMLHASPLLTAGEKSNDRTADRTMSDDTERFHRGTSEFVSMPNLKMPYSRNVNVNLASEIGGVHAYEARLRLGNTGLRSLGFVRRFSPASFAAVCRVSFAGLGSLIWGGAREHHRHGPSINTGSRGTYHTVEAGKRYTSVR
jgi:hypothetical protein